MRRGLDLEVADDPADQPGMIWPMTGMVRVTVSGSPRSNAADGQPVRLVAKGILAAGAPAAGDG